MTDSDKFKKLVAGKRCIVVAPSGYLLGRGRLSGEFIESFDLIIKSTDMCEMADPQGELGHRCDIWYGMPKNSMWQMNIDFLNHQQVRHLRFQPPPKGYEDLWQGYMEWFQAQPFRDDIPSSQIDIEGYSELCDRFSSIPFTGVLAVWDLLNQGAAEVYAYGHDFYRTGYFIDLDSRAAIDNEWHKLRPQAEYFWEQLNQSSNFNCDVNLQQILHSEFSDNFDEADWVMSLLRSELTFFNHQEFGATLLLRTCKLQAFKRIYHVSCELQSITSLLVLAQSAVISELDKHSQVDLVEYQKGNKITLEGLLNTSNLEQHFDTCLIPYNELELFNYLDIFLFLKDRRCRNVYLISMRGIVKKIHDLDKTIEEIQRYLSIKDEFKWLEDKYDRKQCI